jgi:hypothetical protein
MAAAASNLTPVCCLNNTNWEFVAVAYNIKAVCSKSNERKIVIQCVMDEYEESNTTIRARHQKLFKDDTYKFGASKELVMCMSFDFIEGLKDKKWTHIDK